MKIFKYLCYAIVFFIISCTASTNNTNFIKKVGGRYLFNSDEIIKIYFKESELYMEWRGAKSIKPLKINENTFFVKEMNEKIQFLTNPINQKEYIVLVPKEKEKKVTYNYIKLESHENVPSEYLKNGEFDKALNAYLAIKQKDSLDPSLNERNFNSLGYEQLRMKKFDEAIQFFSINVALYPKSANVYDSLGEAFLKSGDTAQAIYNYNKSIKLDSGNARAKKLIKKLEKK